MMLEDYEEGTLSVRVPVRKHWYQFWVPKYVMMEYGMYTRVGKVIKIYLSRFGVVHGELITGLPGKGE